MTDVNQELKKIGIKVPRGSKTQFKSLCPFCSHTRKNNPDEECLSVNTEATGFDGRACVLWNCKHCARSGKIDKDGVEIEPVSFSKRQEFISLPENPLINPKATKRLYKFFAERFIPKEIVDLYSITESQRKLSRKHHSVPVISFPFTKNGEIVNYQFQTYPDEKGRKDYRMIPGAELCVFGLDDLVEDGQIAFDTLIITEGLKDKLALRVAGYKNVVSVPNGALPVGADYGNALQYLDDPDLQLVINHVSKVILATDGDGPGKYLAEAISLRIGQEKCQKVEYPDGLKDANEILVKSGPEALIDFISAAKDYPVAGVLEPEDFEDKVFRLYETGITPGYSTGIEGLDNIITFKLGYTYIITAQPHIGKTEFIDWLIQGLAEREGLHVTSFDPESFPIEEKIAKFAQLYMKVPFGRPDSKHRMTVEQLREGYEWVKRHFTWIMPETSSIDEILRLAKQQILKHGSKILIIDPFTEIEEDKDNSHKFIKSFLSRVNRFAAANEVIIIVVTHPTKEAKIDKATGEYPRVTAYDIADSSHWFNKGFFIISLWRSIKNPDNYLRVWIEKAKKKAVGIAGKFVDLSYDDSIGQFYFEGEGEADYEEEFEDLNERQSRSKIGNSAQNAKRRQETRASRSHVSDSNDYLELSRYIIGKKDSKEAKTRQGSNKSRR